MVQIRKSLEIESGSGIRVLPPKTAIKCYGLLGSANGSNSGRKVRLPLFSQWFPSFSTVAKAPPSEPRVIGSNPIGRAS